jgi:nitroreductase
MKGMMENIIKPEPTIRQQILTNIIRERRSIFADDYLDKAIPREIIEEILTNATWAPNHKMTQPWRFVVLRGLQREKFGTFMAEYYKTRLPPEDFPPDRYERVLTYPLQAACMIVIILTKSTKVIIPEWEELAAVSCAVQNIALSCTAYDIGGYWDSCDACIAYAHMLGLGDMEKCLGFFYMGYYDPEKYRSAKRRTILTKKVEWLED